MFHAQLCGIVMGCTLNQLRNVYNMRSMAWAGMVVYESKSLDISLLLHLLSNVITILFRRHNCVTVNRE